MTQEAIKKVLDKHAAELLTVLESEVQTRVFDLFTEISDAILAANYQRLAEADVERRTWIAARALIRAHRMEVNQ